MNKMQRKLAIILSLLISVQFFCFTQSASAHSHQETVDCCDTQIVECRLEEQVLSDSTINIEKEILPNNFSDLINLIGLNQASNISFSEFKLPDRNLKEISTIRLLL